MEIISTGWAEAGAATIRRANSSARMDHLVVSVRYQAFGSWNCGGKSRFPW
jgi:hypothetical protein